MSASHTILIIRGLPNDLLTTIPENNRQDITKWAAIAEIDIVNRLIIVVSVVDNVPAHFVNRACYNVVLS